MNIEKSKISEYDYLPLEFSTSLIVLVVLMVFVLHTLNSLTTLVLYTVKLNFMSHRKFIIH